METVFFLHLKTTFQSPKKILDVDNDVLYQPTIKSQPEMLYILGLTKITKSDKTWRFEILNCSLF
jgi:hypothetical protein